MSTFGPRPPQHLVPPQPEPQLAQMPLDDRVDAVQNARYQLVDDIDREIEMQQVTIRVASERIRALNEKKRMIMGELQFKEGVALAPG